MKCRLLVDMKAVHTYPIPGHVFRAGTIMDEPTAYILVQIGAAESVDEECAKAANRTPEQLASAQHSYRRTAAGIAPEDFERYDAGEILGYRPDGSYEPGPAWVGEEEEIPIPEDDDGFCSVEYA